MKVLDLLITIHMLRRSRLGYVLVEFPKKVVASLGPFVLGIQHVDLVRRVNRYLSIDLSFETALAAIKTRATANDAEANRCHEDYQNHDEEGEFGRQVLQEILQIDTSLLKEALDGSKGRANVASCLVEVAERSTVLPVFAGIGIIDWDVELEHSLRRIFTQRVNV